jgi:hypothetical protein
VLVPGGRRWESEKYPSTAAFICKGSQIVDGREFTTKLDLKSATADDLPQNCL